MEAQLMAPREREYGGQRVTTKTIYRRVVFSDGIAEGWFDQMEDDRAVRMDVATELRKWRAAERALEAEQGSRYRYVAESYLRVRRKRLGLPPRSWRSL